MKMVGFSLLEKLYSNRFCDNKTLLGGEKVDLSMGLVYSLFTNGGCTYVQFFMFRPIILP